MKLTYGQQLKHPNWQKLRLKMLSAANFICSDCGDDETTLHVHHKQYIKGNLAWEYEDSNFEVLCESCHQQAHQSKDALNHVLAQIPSNLLDEVTDLLIGWTGTSIDSSDQRDPRTVMIGELANIVHFSMRIGQIENLKKLLMERDPYEKDLIITIPKIDRQILSHFEL